MKKVKIMLVALLIGLICSVNNVGATNYKVVDNFPDRLDYVNNTDYPGGYANWNGPNVPFKWWNSTAVYCTMFQAGVSVGPCTRITDNGWSEEVKAGVAAIIKKADADNSTNSDKYYYAEEAINLFLYNFYDSNSAHLPNLYNSINQLGTFKSYYNAAVEAYNKIKAANEKDSNIASITRIDNGPASYSKVSQDITGIQYRVSGIGDEIKASYAINGELPAGVTVELKVGSTTVTNIDEWINVNSGDVITVNILGIGANLAQIRDKNFTVKINIKGKIDYSIAENYNCGYSWAQTYTPNMVKDVQKVGGLQRKITITTDNSPDYPTLQILKNDQTGNPLDGAEFTITQNGEYFDQVESSQNGIYNFGEVVAGRYCIKETHAPSGYKINSDERCFEVSVDGANVNVVIDENDRDKITYSNNIISTTYEDVSTSLKIAKVDKDGNPVVGAKLKLVDYLDIVRYDSLREAPAVVEWTSEADPKEITGLPTGFYWLVEMEAPGGYIFNGLEEVVWVGPYDYSQNNVVYFYNDKTFVNISKVDITTKEELPGATLRLLDENGDVVKIGDEELVWVSTTEQKVIEGLNPGTYYLEETSAPEGYAKMTEKIKFTLDEYGKITIDGSTDDGSVVIMTNAQTKVYISKQDITTKEELPGAHLQLLNEYGKIVEEWDSTNEPKYIEGLAVGTYTLIETTAPDGYSLNTEAVTFTINEDGTITGDTVMYNTPIPDVPNTLSTKSVLITLGGVAIISLGVGLYLNGFKKKEEC